MEKANTKIIIIALVLSLITAALIYFYITAAGKTEAPPPEIKYATVLVAAENIPARTQISMKHIKQVKIAEELLNTSALTEEDDIVGKYTKESIVEGEQFMPQRLADEDNMTLSYIIPEGMRAISMNISEQVSVTNLLRPGDYVDVVASFEKEDEEMDEVTKTYPRISKVILQNVQVLALGQDLTVPADKLSEAPSTVTLAIKKDDVEKFVYASEYATLRLALRPVDDKSASETTGVIRSDMTGQKGVIIKDSDKAVQDQ